MKLSVIDNPRIMTASKVPFALSCLLMMILSACAQKQPSSASSTTDTFAKEWIEAWDTRDVDRILTFYTEDAVYEDVPNVDNGWAALMRGHPMIRESLIETFEEMTDLGFEFVSASDAGERMVVEWIMTGSHYQDYTGQFYVRGVSVIKLKEDKIASVRDYYDAYLLLSQLGIVPSLGAE